MAGQQERRTGLFYVWGFSFFIIFATWNSALANEAEIAHLLNFVASSDCIFQRNGDVHSPAEAREHIDKKYQYLKKRVKTTEQFIRYAATRSSISRKEYTVTCGDRQLTSAQWMATELERFRGLHGEQK